MVSPNSAEEHMQSPPASRSRGGSNPHPPKFHSLDANTEESPPSPRKRDHVARLTPPVETSSSPSPSREEMDSFPIMPMVCQLSSSDDEEGFEQHPDGITVLVPEAQRQLELMIPPHCTALEAVLQIVSFLDPRAQAAARSGQTGRKLRGKYRRFWLYQMNRRLAEDERFIDFSLAREERVFSFRREQTKPTAATPRGRRSCGDSGLNLTAQSFLPSSSFGRRYSATAAENVTSSKVGRQSRRPQRSYQGRLSSSKEGSISPPSGAITQRRRRPERKLNSSAIARTLSDISEHMGSGDLQTLILCDNSTPDRSKSVGSLDPPVVSSPSSSSSCSQHSGNEWRSRDSSPCLQAKFPASRDTPLPSAGRNGSFRKNVSLSVSVRIPEALVPASVRDEIAILSHMDAAGFHLIPTSDMGRNEPDIVMQFILPRQSLVKELEEMVEDHITFRYLSWDFSPIDWKLSSADDKNRGPLAPETPLLPIVATSFYIACFNGTAPDDIRQFHAEFVYQRKTEKKKKKGGLALISRSIEDVKSLGKSAPMLLPHSASSASKSQRQRTSLPFSSDDQPVEVLGLISDGVGASGASIKRVSIAGFICAMKEIDTEKISTAELEQMDIEYSVMRQLPYHSNVARLIGRQRLDNGLLRLFTPLYDGSLTGVIREVYSRKPHRSRGGIGQPSVVMVSVEEAFENVEWKDGSENVRESPFMDMNQIKLILKDIATGLRFLHQNKIIHRDVKPQNILVLKDERSRVKRCVIGDFDTAFQGKKDRLQACSVVGTPGYIAPEVLEANEDHYYSAAVDTYSFGIVCFEILVAMAALSVTSLSRQLVTLREPYFQHKSLKALSEATLSGALPLVPDGLPIEHLRVLKRIAVPCLQRHPSDRISLSNVIELLDSSF